MVPVCRVSKIFDRKLAASGPERLFIDMGRQQGRELGDKFTVYSQERIICHPVHGLKKIWKYDLIQVLHTTIFGLLLKNLWVTRYDTRCPGIHRGWIPYLT